MKSSIITSYIWRAKGSFNTFYRTLYLYWSNRSFGAIGALATHVYKKALRRPTPIHMTIAMTYRCELKCIHCYAEAQQDGRGEELTTQQIKSVIDQARRMGILQIIFSGGEPLLRKDITELIRYARRRGLLTRVNTNGLRLDEEYVSRLKKAGLTQCGVSIDDVDPERHDKLRGRPGTYRKAIEGLKKLKEAGIPSQILTYASKDNINGGLARIINLGKSLGIYAVYIFFPVAVGRWNGQFERTLTHDEKKRVWALQDWTFVHLELPSPSYRCCVVTKSLIYITPSGEVAPCPFTPFYVGNIKDHPLEDLWRCHCENLHLNLRGACPLNYPRTREALRMQMGTGALAVSKLSSGH